MSVSTAGKLYYTDEEKEKALQNNNPLQYALARGYRLKQQNGYYKMAEHDSLVFSPKGYFAWNSQGIQRGDALDFIQNYEGRSFTEAVCILAGTINDPPPMQKDVYIPPPPEKKPFALPEAADNHNYRIMFAYLTKTRGIDTELVKRLVKEGKIYQSKAHNNLVMVGYDEAGKARYASLRSTNTYQPKAFKIDVTGSDKSYPFVIEGEKHSNTVCVFESPIEAMSYWSLCKATQSEHIRYPMISLGGAASPLSLDRYLREHSEIQNIIVGLNNDSQVFGHELNAGQNGTKNIKQKYGGKYQITVHTPFLNDWNDVLKNYRENLEPQLKAIQKGAQEHASPARTRAPAKTQQKGMER